jgi:DNA primase
LHALVNKFIREKINKEENRINREEADNFAQPKQPFEIEDDAALLLNKDEMHERAMIRSLLEFGLKQWDDEKKVADYVFNEFDMNQLEELIDNRSLIPVLQTYKIWYDEGIEPTPKNFLYYENQQMSALVVSIMDFKYEISPNWSNFYEGKIPSREELYKEEIFSTLNYLKLRKIKRLINENQQDLAKAHSSDEQMVLLQTHQHLKQMEIELTKPIGTVIFR